MFSNIFYNDYLFNYLSFDSNLISKIPYTFPCKNLISHIALPLLNLYPPAAKHAVISNNLVRWANRVSFSKKPATIVEIKVRKKLSKNSIFYRCFNEGSSFGTTIISLNVGLSFYPTFSRLNSIIRTIHEIFISYCHLLEKQEGFAYGLNNMPIEGRNAAIQIRLPSFQKTRQNLICKLIEKIAHFAFFLFPSQNTKEIAVAASALNAIRIAFQKWNHPQPLETARYWLIAAVKSYPIYAAIFPEKTPWIDNQSSKEKNPFLDALEENEFPDLLEKGYRKFEQAKPFNTKQKLENLGY